MTLNKRYKRDIKNNLSLYVSSMLLTMLSLRLFYLFHICGTGILGFSEDFFNKHNVEDANFSTYMEISDYDLGYYEDKYNLELEKQKYMNIEEDGTTARVFQKTEEIDLYEITEGRDVKSDDEIIISEGYAVNKKISIGDKIKIKDKDYTVCGFMQRPDYLYMLENLSDSYKNVSTFFLCYMTDDEFDSLGDKNCQYLVRYNEDNNKEFREEINDDYIMSSYISAEDNTRISMVKDQPEIFLITAYMILFTLPLLVVFLISMILSRKIRSEQKMIGTLVAYGYTKGQIIKHYAGFSAIPGIIGGILTTIVVAKSAGPYGALGLTDYEPMRVAFELDVSQMILGIVLPTIMYVISTVFTVNRLLKNDITVLLSGAAKGKNKIKKFLVGRNVSFRTKFSVRSIFGNPGRSLVLFLGVFLGSFVILFALGDKDSIKNITDVNEKNMEKYNYQYTLNRLDDENDYGGETMLVASIEDKDENKISLLGADGNSLVGLKDMQGKELDINDGYIVTSLYARLEGIEKGDKIKVVNSLSTESFEIEIDEIADNNFSKAIYTSRENVADISGMDEDYYNIILSKEKLDIPEKDVMNIINKDNIEKQFEVGLSQLNSMIYAFAIVGLMICIIGVYISVNMVVTENRLNISMLKVLGYSDKRVNKLILNDNIFIVILAIIASIPCALAFGNALFKSFVDTLGYLVEVYVEPSTYVKSIALVLLGYFVSMYMVSRKVGKVDMVESLKDNRE